MNVAPANFAGFSDIETNSSSAILVDAIVGVAPLPEGSTGSQISAAPQVLKRAYPAPTEIPTQEGPKGIRFDYNDGCRVLLPQSDRSWRVRLSDSETGNILFETEIVGGLINSTKRYFVRVKIEIWQGDDSIFTHEYSAKGRKVLIQFPVGTLGDPLGWFPYAPKFQKLHDCELSCAIGDKLIALFKGAYPEINFVTHDDVKTSEFYATYSIGLFFDDKDFVFQPSDFRHVGLHRTAAYILGVDPTEVRPRLSIEDNSRPIAEPYVVIAAQSTTQAKYWNNPDGWRSVVTFLKEAGYRVICIDQKPVHGHGLLWNHIPFGVEDETGDKPLSERVRYLQHAEFFVGLSSGLSWLAWAADIPVVMISGFTHPTNEFHTPFRVINYHACNSCWNDPRLRFEHHNFLWCPRQKDTPRQFECTRLITADHVKSVIRMIPGFGSGARADAPKESSKPGRGDRGPRTR